MPGVSQIVFVAQYLNQNSVESKSVLDVGSCNFNGSIKPLVLSYKPAKYHGVDIISGRDVDQVLSATEIVNTFGRDSFDIIICLEMLEHAKDWKLCVSNLKQALKPHGKLFLTTRSPGYPCHGFPNDFWRFTKRDFEEIFSDMSSVVVEEDPIEPGVFLYACKSEAFKEQDQSNKEIFCIMTGDLQKAVPANLSTHPYFKRLASREKLKSIFNSCTRFLAKLASNFFNLGR